jgi:hypothetical protein
LALLLVAVVVLEILRRERVFALAALLASLGFALSLGIMNVDGFIVRQNVDRAVQGETFDASYLMGLSTDSVPALAEVYRTQSLPDSIQEGVGAALACFSRVGQPGKQPAPWQSFHVSSATAERILAPLSQNLGQYKIEVDDWSNSVVTPSGKEYYCGTYWD